MVDIFTAAQAPHPRHHNGNTKIEVWSAIPEVVPGR
jgi:hypothetical protein